MIRQEKTIHLQNRYLAVEFLATGSLVRLAPSVHHPSLIDSSTHGYFECESNGWFGNLPGTAAIPLGIVCVNATPTSLTIVYRSEQIEWTTRYDLPPKSPFLCVTVWLKTTGSQGRLMHLSLPRITFVSSFNNVFEDERDLYCDGAEVGNGRELPCWRVFFQRGHNTGLILATRSKANMARVNILARGFEIQPHHCFNYSTVQVGNRPPLDSARHATHTAEFEIGPWTRAKHPRILSLAGLDQPCRVAHPPAQGRPPATRKGKTIHALTIAPGSATCAHHPRKWMLARLPWAQTGRALVAGSGVRPPPIRIHPRLTGPHRVFVGIGNGAGICVRLSGEPETSIRSASLDATHRAQPTPFSLFLSGRHRAREVECGTGHMDGRSVVIERFPNLFTTTMFDYVRFEKLSPSQARAWEAAEKTPSRIELSGFNDIPDIAQFTDIADPDPAAYRANIWEHARCGFKRIYWRIDGQCSDFPSRHNTMRYVSAKVHGVFHPPAKAYGRVLKKTDMLALAVEAARKYGVELYGWMRFNNYSGNVQSDFYKKNPSYREEWENGQPAAKLCLAIPEVRAHKIAILIEAASYGLQGLNLGLLRHPPVLLYHPVVLESFRKKHGLLPPRDPHNPDPRFDNALPPGDEAHARWYQHRADFMTIFGRELRAALQAKGLGHVKISLWLRPNHCLFDGIDLPAWLDQGLCDEVVVNGVIGPELCQSDKYDAAVCGVKADWKKMVRAKVPLVRCLAYREFARWKRDLPRADIDSYDGLCTYESDWAVLDSDFIKFYRSLRR